MKFTKYVATFLLLTGLAFGIRTVAVTPSSTSLRSGKTTQFTAVVSDGAKNQKVVWSTTSGTITPTGLYTMGSANAVVTAVWTGAPKRVKGTAQATFVAGAPKTYSVARTDSLVTQLPNPMPKWLGAGTTWCNPAFNNICITQLTDQKSCGGIGSGSYLTANGGGPNLISSDSKHAIVHGPGGRKCIVGYDAATHKVSNTPILLSLDSLEFSDSDPVVIYGLNGSQLHKVVVAADFSAVVSDTIFFDFVACLPANYGTITWNGTFSPTRGDTSFRTAFSNSGAQGSGDIVASYLTQKVGNVGPGCYTVNTKTGQVFGPAGLIGTMDDGVNPLVERFTLHEAGGGQNPSYGMVGPSLHQPNGDPGCLIGNCTRYSWEVGTTHLRPCDVKCDGHSAQGNVSFATGKQGRLHTYSNPLLPLTPLFVPPPGYPDHHGTWNNANDDDSTPPVFVTTDVTPIIPYPGALYDEIWAPAPDGSLKLWRFGQTLNSGLSKYFIAQNAVGVNDQMGSMVMFTSDMCGTACGLTPALGFEKDGVTPAVEVFIMELK